MKVIHAALSGLLGEIREASKAEDGVRLAAVMQSVNALETRTKDFVEVNEAFLHALFADRKHEALGGVENVFGFLSSFQAPRSDGV